METGDGEVGQEGQPSRAWESRSRLLPLDGAFNLRDIGGLRAGSRKVKEGLLFRADALDQLSVGDQRRVAALGIRTVIDLRTPSELPDADRLASIDALHRVQAPLSYRTWDESKIGVGTAASDYIADRYIEIAVESGPAVGSVLSVLADRRALPAVVHCGLGKDRTGLLIAITLSLVGVDDESIAVDYSLTGQGLERMRVVATSSEDPGLLMRLNQPPAFLSAPAAAIVGFLQGIRDQFGSIEGFAATTGVSRAQVDAVRSHLLDS
jgi:protein tyrosine/serine phosphatase